MNPYLRSNSLGAFADTLPLPARRRQEQGDNGATLHSQRNLAAQAASTLPPVAVRAAVSTPQRLIVQSAFTLGAGTPIAIDLPRQWTYDRVDLELSAGGTLLTTAQILAQVALVRVVVDSDIIWELTPTELFALTNYRHGIPADNGIIPFRFARPTNPRIVEQDAYAIGTGGLQNFQVVIILIAGYTIDKIVPYAMVRPNKPFGRFLAYRTARVPIGATGIQEFPNIQQSPKFWLEAIHFIGAASDASLAVNLIQLYAFGGNFLDGTKNINDMWLKEYSLVPQAGWVHLDLQFRQRTNDDMQMIVTDFKPKLGFTSNPGTVLLILERLEQR